MGKKKSTPNAPTQVMQQAQSSYQTTQQPSQSENQASAYAQNLQGQASEANARSKQDYGNIMGAYENFRNNLGGPSRFGFQRVSAERPPELDKAYQGYGEFSNTGGYSPQDIADLRSRGVSPIRAAYGNTMMEMDRARSLGGESGTPNYIAALSRAQRELPGQISDATQNVNAGLADSIRQGKMFGISGMGNLSSQESGRMLQAGMSNQDADLHAQGMGEQSLQNLRQSQLASMGGQSNLYGTTPGMSSMFGNQALSASGQHAGMEQSRNQFGLGLLDAQLRGYNSKGPSKWKTALSVAGTVAPYVAMAASSREVKHDIKRVKNTSMFSKNLKNLPLYTWKYNGDNVKHFGPIAEEFRDKFGIGDGKTLHLADVMGVMLASQKEALNNA